MKNRVLVILFCLISAYAFWENNSGNDFEIISEVSKVVEQFQSKNTDIRPNESGQAEESDTGLQLNDVVSSQNIYELIDKNRGQLGAYVPQVQKHISDTSTCILSNECKDEPDPNSAYYDENNSTFHRELNNSLLFLKLAVDEDDSLRSYIEPAVLIKNLKIANAETKLLSIQLLLQNELNTSEYQEILNLSENFTGKAKALAFVTLSSEVAADNQRKKEAFVDTLQKSIAKDDVHTIFFLVENLNSMNLSEDSSFKVLKSSCYLKKYNKEESLWLRFKKQLDNYTEGNGFDFNVDQVCPS